MGRVLIKYAILFLVLVLVQVLFLNQVQFSGFANPYIYILFVMLLPVSSPKSVVLISAFLLGLSVDIFSNTLGMHAVATVFIAYLRPLIIRGITNREEDMSDYPGLKQNGIGWFFYYTTLMVVLHHLVLFFIEVYTFTNFLETLYRILLSSVFSIFVIVLSQFIVFRD
ncbi:rod shape-determining protein MreD [Prolixibacteraceae bacterium Z1-6]|uniref:Rod shape-determining protein MreD n=1 Tax=Draconibacterium aestuarii TaxID=2998507 RepID=A0A9X3FBW8_9BACT|nr:rod shape-determining protein MreD [Prolixibacteraceae bacterium Z1-6]